MLLRRRVQLVFIALALLVAIDVGMGAYLIHERDVVRRDVADRWDPARDQVNALLLGLVDQETGQRGFLITGQQQFLDPYGAGGRRVDDALDRLEVLVGADPQVQPRLRRAEDRITAWRQLGADFEIAAKQAERDEDVVDLVSTGTSKKLFDEASTEIADLRETITQRLAQDEDMLDDLRSLIARLEAGSAVVALGLAGGGSYFLRRWMSRPLDRLSHAVRTVAAGELGHTIPLDGPAELANLGRDVDAMRQRILAELDDASRARASLLQRGMIVLTLRDELAPAAIEPPACWQVATRFSPAETIVAGDWYEVRRIGDRGLVFAMGDVSGHGPEVAVFALKTKQLVGIAIDLGLSPAAIWTWVADRLGDTGDRFLTGVIGVADQSTDTLTYSSAGHPALLLCADDEVTSLSATGPFVGPLPGMWTDATATLRPGSSVVAYSDGLLEIQNADRRWAEVDDLVQELTSVDADDVERVADRCLAFYERHSDGQRVDDLTVVVVGASAVEMTDR